MEQFATRRLSRNGFERNLVERDDLYTDAGPVSSGFLADVDDVRRWTL